MLRAFPVSLTGAASRWLRNQPSGSITTWEEPDESLFRAWERFKELMMKCPRHYLTDMHEVILFYNGLDVPLKNPGLKSVLGHDPSAQVQDVNILDAYDHTLPQKEKDTGSFTLPCFIHNICFNKALVDLGASKSVMPFSTYTNFGLGILSHTRLTIELADRTIKQARGIAENVLVRIGKREAAAVVWWCEVTAQRCVWWGSNRSGDEESFGTWPEKSAGKVAAVVASGGGGGWPELSPDTPYPPVGYDVSNLLMRTTVPIKINGLTQDRFRLSIFPVSLAEAAYEWFIKKCIGSITTWDNMLEKFILKFNYLSDHNKEETKEDDNPNETNNIPEILRIEGNLFDFETPLWYDELADGKLKDETLTIKTKIEGSWGDATPGVLKFCEWLKSCFENFHEIEYKVVVKLQECWWKVNAHEIALFTHMENFGRGSYADIKTEWTNNPYLDINHTIGRDYEATNTGCTQEN
ncbi:reverse transcriptase domain, reverse transcriptase zinc-binding domain protein [Tanacetum coccineum]